MNQKQCKMCKGYALDPIMLICSHYLCYECGLKIQFHDTTSLIQGKFRIQCPDCRRQTYTYEIQNLLLDTQELNLITDSSELDKEQLHESQLSHNAIPQQDPIFQRRVSKLIERSDINFQVYNNDKNTMAYKEPLIKLIKGINMTPTNHTQQVFNHQSRPVPTSEKVSPTRSIAYQNQRKSSLMYQLDSSFSIQNLVNIDVDERNLAVSSQNQNAQNQKPCFEPTKILSAVSTPCSTPYQIGFNAQQTTNKESHQRQYSDIGQTYNQLFERVPIALKEQQQFFRPDSGSYNPQLDKENHHQETSFVVQKKPSPSQPYCSQIKHKRSSTGLPVSQQVPDNDQSQVIQFYFQMLQKNLQKVEQDILSKLQKNKNIDANFLYSRLKRLSQKLQSKNEDDLIQQIRVIQELRVELSSSENIKHQPQYINPQKKIL